MPELIISHEGYDNSPFGYIPKGSTVQKSATEEYDDYIVVELATPSDEEAQMIKRERLTLAELGSSVRFQKQ